MATYAEYTKMSREQLTKELENLRKALFDIRYQVTNKQSKADHEITNHKKSIAQILTALNASTATKDLESKEKTVQNAPAIAKPKSLSGEKEKAVKAPRKAKAKKE